VFVPAMSAQTVRASRTRYRLEAGETLLIAR